MDLLPERNCSTCTLKNKREWGCEEDAATTMSFDGEEIRRCPRRPLLDDIEQFSFVFWAYERYKEGMLLEDGGVLSQPGKMVEIYTVIDRAHNSAAHFKRLQEQKEAARANYKAKRRR